MVLNVPMPEARLAALAKVDPWLIADVEDWAILVALYQQRVHGFITTDDSMLHTPKLLPVLLQTNLTLVVCEEAGHDAIVATGLVLLHLPRIARRWVDHPQLWVLRSPAEKASEATENRIDRLAKGQARRAFVRRHQISQENLIKPLRDWYVPQEPLLPEER